MLVCILEEIFPEDDLLGAVTGVKTWSELTDVRSVLRSHDVQEESEETEETEGLVSSVSFCHPSPRSMEKE